jgi:hypothetical protein
MQALTKKALAKMSTVMDIQEMLQNHKVLRSLYLVTHTSKFSYKLTQVSRRQNIIETSEAEGDPQEIMQDVGLNPQKKLEVYREIKQHLNGSRVDESTLGESILMKEATRKGGYFEKETNISELDSAMIDVLNDVWRRYDPNNIG